MNNRILLAGTALGVVLGAGAANAQITVTLSGDNYFEAGYIKKEGTANESLYSSDSVRTRTRLVLTAEGKADNGLTYGVRARLRLRDDSNVDFDQSFTYIGGAWGTIKLGTDYGIEDRQKVLAPNSFGTGGIDGSALEWFQGSTGAGTVKVRTGGDLPPIYSYTQDKTLVGALSTETAANRIYYISPRIFGVEAALAYAPTTSSSGTDVGRSIIGGLTGDANGGGAGFVTYGTTKDTQSSINPNFQNTIEGGLNYTDSFGDLKVKANIDGIHGNTNTNYVNSGGISSTGASAVVTATTGFTKANHYDLNAVMGGLQTTFAGFSVGGGAMWEGKSGLARGAAYNHASEYSYNAGAQYAFGPWVAGFNYAYAQDPGSPFGYGAKKLDFYSVGGRYIVATGLDVDLEYDRVNVTNSTYSGAPNTDANIVILRTNMTF